MELNITKKEFKEAKNYIFTCANMTKNGITGWNFYLLFKNGEIKQVRGGNCWSEKAGFYHNTAWGLDRALDILLAVGQDLGLKFHEIDQGRMLKL